MAETVIGKFKLGEELGRGPLGKVYAATNVETGEEVVFRGFARPKDADEAHWDASIKRFTEELTAAQKLDHPNIAKVIEFGELDGMYYVATENFRGKNLRQLLDETGTLADEEARPIVEQICHAIDYARTQGVAHEDLTPYNVMILDDGAVKIINYGLGHIRSKLGSPYVAPEVLQGAEADFVSDLHALGALWFGMLVGRVPFDGSNPQELGDAILSRRPPPATAAAPHVQGIIEKLLEKNPEKRYDSGVAVINDLVSGMIPAGYERSVVKPPALTVSWNAQDYEEDPSLGHYKLEDSDVAEIHRQIAVQREVKQYERSGVGKRIALAVVGILAVAFVFDGFRQVRVRSRLAVLDVSGTAEVKGPRDETWRPLAPGSLISSGEVLRTGDNAQLTVQTYNHTRLRLAANTSVDVQTAGFDAETKSRSVACLLGQGKLWAHVKPGRGETPPLLVACRGTFVKVTGTTLSIDAPGHTNTVEVGCLTGTATAGDGQSGTDISGGQLAELFAGQLQGSVEELSPEALAELQKLEEELAKQSLGDAIRLVLNALQEPVIVSPIAAVAGIKGIVGGKSKADSTAIITATGSMMALMRAMELSTEYPQEVNLKTLEGIQLDKEGRARILAQFHDEKLLSYRLVGGGYEIIARAKDSEHTYVVLRNGKTQTFSEEEWTAKAKGGGGM